MDFNIDHPTNSDGRITKHGSWTFPIWPQMNLVGSPPTPYIYDSRITIEDIVNRLNEVYNIDKPTRKKIGLAGREWMMSNESGMSATKMCNSMMKYIDASMDNFKRRDRYTITKVHHHEKLKNTGVYNNINKIWE
jgi:hypothetical protein